MPTTACVYEESPLGLLERVSCPICGRNDSVPVWRKFGMIIGRCRGCGLVYTNPRLPPSQIWTRYSREYFWNEYLPTLGIGADGEVDIEAFRRHFTPLLTLIARFVPPPARLLEVGAAAGLFLKAAEMTGYAVCGLELSPEAVAFGRDRLGLDLRQEAAEEMTFPDRSFDVVVMCETIEHLLDPLAAVGAIHRSLEPGGALVVTTPNIDAMSRFGLGTQWSVLSPAEHLYYFSERTLTRLLERAGFREVTFERHHAPGPIETMNPDHTNAPGSWRATLYAEFVQCFGDLMFWNVQERGRADTLVSVAIS
jgi:2-polyprenyl-3-methyl-5-hydroxy-6-metoxy-1,4-benzoquinol methylase